MVMPPEFSELMAIEMREATQQAEELLALEDKGWINISGQKPSPAGVTEAERRATVATARVYAANDPLAKQSIRLWTSYTLGVGITWNTDEKAVQTIIDAFWLSPLNRGVLSSTGQRKSSDKTLIDGEIFFAVFIEGDKTARIRRLDTLEITEIITDPDDVEDVRYYRRQWVDAAGKDHTSIYRSHTNADDVAVRVADGTDIVATDDTNEAVVFHLAINTIGMRGNSLLLPAIPWIKLHRKFLASRAAIMLALARFAWKAKVKGGPGVIATMRAKLQDKLPEAASVAYENEGFELTPMNANSQAKNASNDARMLKLQIMAAVGWPEQYFGDISTGNLATAKTVELPVMKMCQMYQREWADLYDSIDRYILSQNGIAEDKQRIDRDFPAISPEDAGELAKSIAALVPIFPDFAENRSVIQQALEAMGVNDIQAVVDEIMALADGEGTEESGDLRRTARMAKALTILEGELDGKRNGNVGSMRVV